jgi:magnesium and cobalt transporter
MIEGVLQVSELHARDIMVPRSQMYVVDIHDTPEKFLPQVIESGHSRFPVIGESRDDVIGILLAKDLLRYFAGQEYNVREMLRPAVFIPESKRLNVLLKDFRETAATWRSSSTNMAGCGLVTIEDVLEQIVGDIRANTFDETEVTCCWTATAVPGKAQTSIEDFHTTFRTLFSDENTTRRRLLLSLRAPAQTRRGDG